MTHEFRPTAIRNVCRRCILPLSDPVHAGYAVSDRALDEANEARRALLRPGLTFTYALNTYTLGDENLPDIPRPELDMAIALLRYAVEALEAQRSAGYRS